MAATPFIFECDRDYGIIPDPNEHKRFGYITKLDGFGLTSPAAPDLVVSFPYSGQPKYTGITLRQPAVSNSLQNASVVGIMESFSWAGNVGDMIELDFWCSQENAFTIKALQQAVLKNTTLKGLGWWIANYDQERKQWFEQSYPISAAAITGIIAGKENPALNVDLNPLPVKEGIDVNLYKISMSVAPAANQPYNLHFANSAANPLVKTWGLAIGNLAAAPIQHPAS